MSTQAQKAAAARMREAKRLKQENRLTPKPNPRSVHTAQREPVSSKPFRPTRAEATQQERRRRRAGTLNRMASFKLDIFAPEQLDPEYEYRWVSDDGSRLRMMTRQDDYDYVNASEIKDFSIDDMTDSEAGSRISMIEGRDKNGNPQRCYLLKKKKAFCEEDRRAAMAFRADMMEQRVYRGQLNSRDEKGSEQEHFYALPESNLIHGMPEGRRRGPMTSTVFEET